MKYININKHIINLEEICHAYPEFGKLCITFKNGQTAELGFYTDGEKRDQALKEIWLALTNMK